MVTALGLEGGSPAAILGIGEIRVKDAKDSADPDLGPEETTMFRAVAARLNNLSQDWPDITFATLSTMLEDVSVWTLSAGHTGPKEH